MTTLHADKEVSIVHGGNTVRLRASLRAATQLERLHDGFAPLFKKVEQFDTATIRSLVTIAALDRSAAEAFLSKAATLPLKTFTQATHGPLIAFCAALLPTSDDTPDPTGKPAKTMTWAAAFAELYRVATGWLGWPPEAAWIAHPNEITEALKGHVSKLQLMNGATPVDEDQRAENIALGLDPDFDRAGLQALKNMMGG